MEKGAKKKKLGKYIIDSELGHGAMGVIYKAFDPFIKRDVALKTINKEILQRKDADIEEIMSRFKREAQAAGRLNHQNIVSVYEYGEDGDTAFIALEIVNGRELKDVFDNNERIGDINHVAQILYQLLDALSHSHNHGVIHRDIKPSNIFLMDTGKIKVADFGIARIESSELTQIGTMLGTPDYMSPEQIRGQPVDARTDIFSAGVLFYQLITGEKPFYGKSMTTILHKVLNEDPINPSILNCNVSSAMDMVVQKALAKKVAHRFQSAEAFAKAIKLALQNNPAGADGDHKSSKAVSGPDAPALESEEDATRIITGNDVSAFKSEDDATILMNNTVDIEETIDIEEKNLDSPSSSRSTALAFVIIILLLICGGAYFWVQYKQAVIKKPNEPSKVTEIPSPPLDEKPEPEPISSPLDNNSKKPETTLAETTPSAPLENREPQGKVKAETVPSPSDELEETGDVNIFLEHLNQMAKDN